MTSPLGKIDTVQKLAIAMAQRREVAEITFGPRAPEVEATAMVLHERSTMNLLPSFEICMQIEDEFPGRVEEIVARSLKLIEETDGMVGSVPQALMQVILTERHRG